MWKDIEELNWAERSQERRGYGQARRYMLENFTKTRCEKIREFISIRYNELAARIEAYEQENDCRVGNYGGDDSFNDMVHHVIGLGETYFNKVMKHPELLNDLDFVESFSYCIPYDSDFEEVQPGHFEIKARECLYELARILKENDPSPEDVKIILGLVKRFCKMAAGEFEAACEGVNEHTYNTFYRFDSNDRQALFANILSDCKKLKVN
jgi:hypothetical protein